VEKIVEVPVNNSSEDEGPMNVQTEEVTITDNVNTENDNIQFNYPPNQNEQTLLAAKRLTYSRPN
jgi:hypothetical protein